MSNNNKTLYLPEYIITYYDKTDKHYFEYCNRNLYRHVHMEYTWGTNSNRNIPTFWNLPLQVSQTLGSSDGRSMVLVSGTTTLQVDIVSPTVVIPAM